MKAMLFAAGLGTRLRPITDSIPKALVQVNGVTLLERSFHFLIAAGVDTIVVNVHHFAEQITTFLSRNNNFGISVIISDETGKLLDTGGGLKKASNHLTGSGPFIIYNCDILTSLDLTAMLQQHTETNADVTLAVRDRNSSRYFLFDAAGRMRGWENTKTGEQRIPQQHKPLQRAAFSGIHIMNASMLDLLPEQEVYSLVDFYLQVCGSKVLRAYYHNAGYWSDVGKPEELTLAEQLLR